MSKTRFQLFVLNCSEWQTQLFDENHCVKNHLPFCLCASAKSWQTGVVSREKYWAEHACLMSEFSQNRLHFCFFHSWTLSDCLSQSSRVVFALDRASRVLQGYKASEGNQDHWLVRAVMNRTLLTGKQSSGIVALSCTSKTKHFTLFYVL